MNGQTDDEKPSGPGGPRGGLRGRGPIRGRGLASRGFLRPGLGSRPPRGMSRGGPPPGGPLSRGGMQRGFPRGGPPVMRGRGGPPLRGGGLRGGPIRGGPAMRGGPINESGSRGRGVAPFMKRGRGDGGPPPKRARGVGMNRGVGLGSTRGRGGSEYGGINSYMPPREYPPKDGYSSLDDGQDYPEYSAVGRDYGPAETSYPPPPPRNYPPSRDYPPSGRDFTDRDYGYSSSSAIPERDYTYSSANRDYGQSYGGERSYEPQSGYASYDTVRSGSYDSYPGGSFSKDYGHSAARSASYTNDGYGYDSYGDNRNSNSYSQARDNYGTSSYQSRPLGTTLPGGGRGSVQSFRYQ